jgi:hypothetical protein
LKFVDYVEEVLSLMLILSSSCLLLILKALTFQKMNLSSLGKVLPLLLKPAGQFIYSTLSVLACGMAAMVSYLICHQMFIIIIAINSPVDGFSFFSFFKHWIVVTFQFFY